MTFPKNMKVSWDYYSLLFPIYGKNWKNKKCSKPLKPDIANWKIHDKYGVSVAGKRYL